MIPHLKHKLPYLGEDCDYYQSYICLVSLVFHIVWVDYHLGIDIVSKKHIAYFDCCIDGPGIGPGICRSADLGEAGEGLLLIIIKFRVCVVGP